MNESIGYVLGFGMKCTEFLTLVMSKPHQVLIQPLTPAASKKHTAEQACEKSHEAE